MLVAARRPARWRRRPGGTRQWRGDRPLRRPGPRRVVGGSGVAERRGPSARGFADDDDVTRIDAVIEATAAAGLAPGVRGGSTRRRRARRVARRVGAPPPAPRRGRARRSRTRRPLPARPPAGAGARRRRPRPTTPSPRAPPPSTSSASSPPSSAAPSCAPTSPSTSPSSSPPVSSSPCERDDPWLAFEWSERQRATALAAAPVRPPDDVELAADLDRLRAALTQFDAEVRDGTRHGTIAPELAPDSAILQDRIRRRARLGRRAVAAAPRAARSRT